MKNLLLVGGGGALGSVLRYGVQTFCFQRWASSFPVGTLVVNVTGAFFMGLFMAWLLRQGNTGLSWRLFFATGVLGGYTTFSALAWDLWQLGAAGTLLRSALYAFLSFFGGIAGVGLGLFVAR